MKAKPCGKGDEMQAISGHKVCPHGSPNRLGVIALSACLIGLTGCASDRFLTKEEDEALRVGCPDKDCVFMPSKVWERIQQLLTQRGARI